MGLPSCRGCLKMADVKILVEGKHERKGDKVHIGSTVTLIRSDKNIIVDTGSFLDREKLILELRKEELSPENIEMVVLTHLHLDHLVNVDLFKNAKIFCKFRGGDYPGQFHILSKGDLQRTHISDDIEIAKDVKFLLTPGHSMDMVSVKVGTKKGIVVIAGDPISSEEWVNLKKQPSEMVVVSVEEFNKSREKILKMADYIIPGHGKMFKVKNKLQNG